MPCWRIDLCSIAAQAFAAWAAACGRKLRFFILSLFLNYLFLSALGSAICVGVDIRLLYELIISVVAGLCFGSFVTLVSYRLPLGEDIVVKPSRCTNCQTKLGFLDLWPVFSWLLSNGKCRHCKVAVSVRYPMIELAVGGMFLWLYMQYGFGAQFYMLAALWVALMIMIVIDFEHYIIPDELHYVLVPLGLTYQFWLGNSAESIVLGFLTGMGLGLSLHFGYRFLRRREGLGFGDVKFFALSGLWLGLEQFIPFLFYGGLFGVALGLFWRALGRGAIFPFGPALGLSLFLNLVTDDWANYFWNIGEFIKYHMVDLYYYLFLQN